MRRPRQPSHRSSDRSTLGLSLVEVLVAAAILAVAGLAALELLAEGDRTSREARRIALAATEAEAALAKAADDVRNDRPAALERPLGTDATSESLAGCLLVVSEHHETPAITTGSGATRTIPIVRLVAEIRDAEERVVARLERLAPEPAEVTP